MKYQFDNLSESDVILLGRGIGRLTIDEAGDLHGRLQAQIIAQEAAERDRVETSKAEALAEWREKEVEKLKAATATTTSKKGRK